MAKSRKEKEAARAARQALKAQFAAAGKGRPSDKQIAKAATKAINQEKQATQKSISGIISDGRVIQKEAQIEKLGKANPYSQSLKITTGSRGRPGLYSGEERFTYKTVKNPYYKGPQDIMGETLAAAEEKYAGFKQELSDITAATQADIADQLKIIQGEKSAVSKLMDDYRNMLIEEADAKRKAQEEQKVGLQTARANAARSTLGSNLQIQFGGGVKPFNGGSMQRRSGTGQFKRRLNIGQSNMVNI